MQQAYEKDLSKRKTINVCEENEEFLSVEVRSGIRNQGEKNLFLKC